MLSDAQVKSLKPKESRYSVADGEGLNISVFPNGKKKWVLSYRQNGKQNQKMLGEYPLMGCKEARLQARQLKLEYQGKVANSPPVHKVVEEWLSIMKSQWTSKKYYDTVEYRLAYLTEDFKNLPINEVERKHISKKIKEIVAKGTLETASRALRLGKQVFDFAIASDYTDRNPCTLVEDVIPEYESDSHPCLPASEMPEFFRRMQASHSSSIVKMAMLLVCYTGTRITELLKARWDSGELDFENKVWIIPADRMKRRKELMVPLVPQIYALFKELESVKTDDGYIFKKRGKPYEYMTSESVLTMIKRMGYEDKMVTHGFRSLFSTLANESKLFRGEVIDYQIAHVNKSTKADKTSKIYNRAEYWDERVELMTWYANEVEEWINQNACK
ncbi:tyrosine-type recombinase/integrase [Acinetobacter nosocomialis]|uniref:tyrosine-type recombinase/integrase n=1 Tax=Acinetobacter nosocomialis TaxID=106654 RepID=UPI0026ECF4E6|nr:tyrosine-type recombinase/integrase [Acinetobacter nosocomialis]MDO7219791.1 tyrosine-type recombinase/integrase [Acinetobacter nosocomialis]